MKARFVVSIDTEEDIWGHSSTAPITCVNIGELPRLARFFQRLHVRPTFFVSHQVLSDPSARAVVKDLAGEDGFEIGCHVHPWNTPPYDDSPRRTMLYNLPPEVQASKIATVTRLFEEVLERHPRSFRAGRFGFGSTTAACLIEQGYGVDSSVTPFFDWTGSSGGQNYVGAPLHIYRIDPKRGVLRDDPDGRLIEVPLTGGYTRLTPDSWESVAGFLDHRAARALQLGAVGAWVLALRRAILSPESQGVRDMVALGRRVVGSGVGHLHLFFHSSSLMPGLTPFTRTRSDVERLYDRVEEVIDRLHSSYELEFVSVAKAAELSSLRPVGPALQGSEPVRVVPLKARSTPSSRNAGRKPRRWVGPQGTRARLVYLAQYAYWRLGGYRRFGRVRWSAVRRLVFVCTGNICRSPYAEHVARAWSLDAVSFGVDTRLNGVAYPMALSVARDRGISLDEHRTTPLKDFQPREGDLFVAMEPFQAALVARQGWAVAHQVTLLGLWAGSGGAVIQDPYGGDERRFNDCFALIERGIARIERRLDAASGRAPRGMPPSTGAS